MVYEVAVVGCGSWGRNHIRVLQEMDNVKLTVVVEPEKSRFDSLRLKDVSYVRDHHDLLRHIHLDVVVVASPTSTHYEIVRDCLRAGKDVFVEKPLTLDIVEAKKLVEFAKGRSNILMVGHIFRYSPAVRVAKEVMMGKDFGKVQFIYGLRLGLRTPRADCGVIDDFASHDIDIFSYLLNQPLPSEVTAVGGNYLNDFDDVGFISLKYPNGVLANIQVSWLTPKKIRETWVIGSGQSLRVDGVSDEVEVYSGGVIPTYNSFGEYKMIVSEGDSYKPHIQKREPLKEELKHFLYCVERRETPLTDGVVGLNVVKVLHACRQSMKFKRTVTVK